MIDLMAFAQLLQNDLYYGMPYDTNKDLYANYKPKRRGHIRDIALKQNNIIRVGTNSFSFDLGNTFAETKYPYYHILEDAEVISKRGRGTKTTRGSQDSVAKWQRDYGQTTVRLSFDKDGIYKGREIFKEYRKNVRGKRSKVGKSQSYEFSQFTSGGREIKFYTNSKSKYYTNIHYHFIENIIEPYGLQHLSTHFGLKMLRTQIISDRAETIEKEQQEISDLRNKWSNVDLHLPF